MRGLIRWAPTLVLLTEAGVYVATRGHYPYCGVHGASLGGCGNARPSSIGIGLVPGQ